MINKKLNGFFAYVLLAVVLSSCGDMKSNFPNYQSTWIVTKVEHENKVMANYRMTTTDTTDYNTSDTWVMDSIGKFEIGDTVVFAKHYR